MADKQETDKKGKNCRLFARIMNIVTALTLIGFGIAGVIVMALKQLLAFRFFLVFSPFFMILFGLMLFAAEFKIKIIRKHFKFLNSFLGRGIFNFYLSSSVFFYFSCGNDSTIVAWIAAIIIFVLGFIYCLMHCCCNQHNPEEQKEEITDTTKQQMI